MDIVESTVSRSRVIVVAMAGGVLLFAAASGFVDLEPGRFAVRASFPVGLAGLIALVAGWRLYARMRTAPSSADLETQCSRYSAALLAALAVTEGAALLGVVFFWLGGEIVALTGVASHVLLCGVLWPSAEKIRPSM
jgi:hypothetical protein